MKKEYVPAQRTEFHRGTQAIASGLEQLGFVVEHHKSVKGGAHASRVLFNGLVCLGWCYGAALANFHNGAVCARAAAGLPSYPST